MRLAQTFLLPSTGLFLLLDTTAVPAPRRVTTEDEKAHLSVPSNTSSSELEKVLQERLRLSLDRS